MTPRLRRAALPARRRGSWRAALLAASLLLLAPAAALAWDTGGYSAADESRMVSLVNQRRATAGLSALSTDGTLTSVARSRSKRMGDSHTFSHTIGGKTAFDELRAAGYCFLESAENLAWNSYPDDQATQVAWSSLTGSSTHLANILGAAYTRIGVGAYKAGDGTHVYVLLFVHACGTTATKPPATKAPATKAPATKAPATAPPPRATPRPATPAPAPAIAEAHAAALPSVISGPTAPEVERPPLVETLLFPGIQELLHPLVRSLASSGG